MVILTDFLSKWRDMKISVKPLFSKDNLDKNDTFQCSYLC